jgi:hypothetical protein
MVAGKDERRDVNAVQRGHGPDDLGTEGVVGTAGQEQDTKDQRKIDPSDFHRRDYTPARTKIKDPPETV